MKPYEEMNATECYNVWVMYRNACALCVTFEGRHDYQLSRKRNQKADDLYQGWVRHFTPEDIKEQKEAEK